MSSKDKQVEIEYRYESKPSIHGEPRTSFLRYQHGDLVGKVLTQLELMPLNEVQLKAAKSVFSNILYNWYGSLVTDSERATHPGAKQFWLVNEDGKHIVVLHDGTPLTHQIVELQ